MEDRAIGIKFSYLIVLYSMSSVVMRFNVE
jgi:hypothetical protein